MKPDREKKRLERQLAALAGKSVLGRRLLAVSKGRRAMLLRIPLGILLVIGGFFAILPFFGLWMIPLGLLILAIDMPFMRPFASALIVRLRRWLTNWRRSHKSFFLV